VKSRLVFVIKHLPAPAGAYQRCPSKRGRITYAAHLIALPDQLSGLELQDLSEALSQLPLLQREVLLLVGAEGMSYEEIATHQHVSVGTIKSRVNRARHHLADILGLGPEDAIGIRFTNH
jgi:RNA polymerase sigma-70 factor (ECF subfamily)